MMLARLLACTLLITVMSDAKPAANDLNHAAAMAAGFHPAGVSGKLTQHDYTDIAEIIYRTEGPMPQLDSPWPFTDADFARQDEHDDHDFYAAPRLVHHIDDGARAALSHYYRFLFVDAQRHPQDTAADTAAAEPALPIAVLDLCSSWVSHFPEPRPRRHAARAHVALPPHVPLRRAVGLGLNRQELDANPRLTERVVLDLNATSGLMTWEALRRAPEGHVIATVRSESDADALREQVQPLPELGRPRIVRASLEELSGALTEVEPGLRPERLVGRNVFAGAGGRFAETAAAVAAAAGEAGWVVLAESIPRHTQRVYALVEREGLDDDLVARWIAAEEGIYEVEGDPVVGWGLEEVLVALQQAGLSATGRLERLTTRVQLSRELIERWFAEPSEGRPTYASRLAGALTEDELDQLRALLLTKLANRTVEWANAVGFIEATPGRSATSP